LGRLKSVFESIGLSDTLQKRPRSPLAETLRRRPAS
jgi:hypothetical protein